MRHTRRSWLEQDVSDRILIPCIYSGIIVFVASFIGAWIYNVRNEASFLSWLKFWHVYVYAMFWLGVAFMIWVVTGGFRDLFRMFKGLKTQETDATDDGSVEGHHAAGGEKKE